MSWHEEPLIGFDLETTGINVETARIVTAATVDYKPGDSIDTLPNRARLWLSDVGGMRIPEQATAVHGISTEQARANGRPAAHVADEIADVLAAALSTGIPVVAMNGRYDFTVLDRELRRHQLSTLSERLGGETTPGPVIDPYVIDKQADKFRKGSRRLDALAAHYGVTLSAAHTADADAFAAVQVAVAMAEKYPELQTNPEQLHAWQSWWARQQAAELQAHLRRMDPYVVVDGEWPLIQLTSERKLRGTLDELLERWAPLANCTDDAPAMAHGRANGYRKALADIRDVLRTGLIPHDLMTDAELEQHGAPEGAAK